MASIAASRRAALAAAGADGATALTGGTQEALLFAAALIVVAIGVAWTVLRPDRAEIAELAEDEPDVEAIAEAA